MGLSLRLTLEVANVILPCAAYPEEVNRQLSLVPVCRYCLPKYARILLIRSVSCSRGAGISQLLQRVLNLEIYNLERHHCQLPTLRMVVGFTFAWPRGPGSAILQAQNPPKRLLTNCEHL